MSIGEKEDDPVLVITDLLIHLVTATDGEKRLATVVEGEKLDFLIGSRPIEAMRVRKKKKKLSKQM